MDIEKRYQKALDYIYLFVDFSMTKQARFDPTKMNLEKIQQLAGVCNNPQNQFSVIHITGTKGKGSTASFIASILRAQGYRVGLYTSPHLVDFRERIQFNGRMISRTGLVNLVKRIQPEVAKIQGLTTFDITTMLAFLYFAQKKSDFAVVEVGMGGTLDSTNIVHPLVSVITAVSLDHQYVLGNSIEAIAENKAGIIKPGAPVVVSPQPRSVLEVIEKRAQKLNAPLVKIGDDITCSSIRHSLFEQVFRLSEKGNEEKVYTIPLLGKHQIENAAAAYGAVRQIQQQGFALSEQSIKNGFAHVKWPGRFEFLQQQPAIILDSAHNHDSAVRLAETIHDYLPGEKFILLFGISEDKDLDGMFKELSPYVEQVIAARSIHPRAMETDKIVKLAEEHHLPAVAVEDVREAFDLALQFANGQKAVLVTGSIFMVAAIQEYWMTLKTKHQKQDGNIS